jgi:peroxiredoxin
MSKWRTWVAAAAIVMVAIALVYTLFQPQPKPNQAGKLKVGGTAPDFTATTMEGTSIKLSDFKGKGVLLNFWASWCTPCVEEMPRMNKAYQSKAPSVEIIAVNVGESRGTARDFIAKAGIGFPAWLDPSGEAAQSYRVTGLPATFLIDKNGTLVKAIAGELPDDKTVIQYLELIQP